MAGIVDHSEHSTAEGAAEFMRLDKSVTGSVTATACLRLQQFEALHAAWFDKFLWETRKKPICKTLQQKPVSVLVLLAEYWYMISAITRLAPPSNDGERFTLVFFLRLVTSLAAGIYASSFLTGILHMIFDNIPIQMYTQQNMEDLPILQRIGVGFQLHHAIQHNWTMQDIFSHGILLVGTTGTTLGFTLFLLLDYQQCLTFCPAVGILVFCGFVLNTQVIHACAHSTFVKSHPTAHAFYLRLASLGLVLDPKRHSVHHTRFDANFCITNSWADPLVNWIYQWLLAHDYIAPDMVPERQRQIYHPTNKKTLALKLKRPYYQVFAEWNQLQQQVQQHKQ